MAELWQPDEIGPPARLTVVPDPGHEPDRVPGERFESASYLEDELGSLPASTALIGGVLDEDTMTILYGPPKSGKSFIALSWAMSLVTGAYWLGGDDHPVTAGPVVYVAAEGSRGFRARIGAWRQQHNVRAGGELHVVTRSIRLMSPLDVSDFVVYAAKRHPKMIVIDTLARCMVGADENSAKDVGVVIQHLEEIRQATGAAVVAVHHSGRSGENMRGSSAFDGAVDMGYAVSRDAATVHLERKHAKDHPDGRRWKLSLVTAAGSKSIDRFQPDPSGDLADGAMVLLALLVEIDPHRAGIGAADWEKALPSSIPLNSYFRLRGGLMSRGYVDPVKKGNSTKYQVTDAGLAALSGDAGQLLLDAPEHDHEPF